MNARFVILQMLADAPRTPKQIVKDTGLRQRTVTTALRELRRAGRVPKSPNLLDMRTVVYSLVDRPEGSL